MAGIDLGKGLQSLFKGAADAVNGAVDTVKNVTKDVKLPEIKPEQITGIFTRKPAEEPQASAEPAAITNISVRNQTLLQCQWHRSPRHGEPHSRKQGWPVR